MTEAMSIIHRAILGPQRTAEQPSELALHLETERVEQAAEAARKRALKRRINEKIKRLQRMKRALG